MVGSRDDLILPKPKHLSSRLRLGGTLSLRVYAQAINERFSSRLCYCHPLYLQFVYYVKNLFAN